MNMVAPIYTQIYKELPRQTFLSVPQVPPQVPPLVPLRALPSAAPLTESSPSPTYNKSMRFAPESENLCGTNKHVVFPKKKYNPSVYFKYVNTKGSLGCTNQYPKYENGIYCCSDTAATNQELLDYVNILIDAAMDNVSGSVFYYYETSINDLIEKRRSLLRQINYMNPKTWVVNDKRTNEINDWLREIKNAADELSSIRPDPLKHTMSVNTKQNQTLIQMNYILIY